MKIEISGEISYKKIHPMNKFSQEKNSDFVLSTFECKRT